MQHFTANERGRKPAGKCKEEWVCDYVYRDMRGREDLPQEAISIPIANAAVVSRLPIPGSGRLTGRISIPSRRTRITTCTAWMRCGRSG